MAGGAWICTGDDGAAECEAPRPVSEATARGEGEGTGAVGEVEGEDNHDSIDD